MRFDIVKPVREYPTAGRRHSNRIEISHLIDPQSGCIASSGLNPMGILAQQYFEASLVSSSDAVNATPA